MHLDELKRLFLDAGCTRLYAKQLAENDNSKNQVYFGPSFEALNLFPNKGIATGTTSHNPIFKARIHFSWLLPNGNLAVAPGAQMILYPQYPEVRFSGFLLGCKGGPSDLMASRRAGRILFLGVTPEGLVVGHVVAGDSETAHEFRALGLAQDCGVFSTVTLAGIPGGADPRARLLAELGRIHRLGWIDSKQLDSHGVLKPCNAPQCGGFTLEAELGIAKNSAAEPDFLGWEVKQHSVSTFARPASGSPITLMTPEPSAGFYREQGVEAFIRRFGYPDRGGRLDRLNFGGVHRLGVPQPATGLTLQLVGYDLSRGLITDAEGAIALLSTDGDVAAAWPFSRLLSHWSRKHARAAYVPSMRRDAPGRQYAYGNLVRLALRTNALRLLAAVAAGLVYYDPGIKLEHASTDAEVKRRSQFRIASKHIGALYECVEEVEV